MSASLTHKSRNASHGRGCNFASCPACENSFENMEVTYTLFIDVRGSISLLLDKFFVAEVEVVVKQILYERSNIFSISVPYYPKRAPQKVLR